MYYLIESFGIIFVIAVLILPIYLSGKNIIEFVYYFTDKQEKKSIKFFELFGITFGIFCAYLYIDFADILFVPYNTVIYDFEYYFMINPNYFLTILTLSGLGFLGYLILRFAKAENLSPVISSIAMGSIYIGIIILIIFLVQTYNSIAFLILTVNMILVYIKTSLIFIIEKADLLNIENSKLPFLAKFICKVDNLPLIALIFMLPILAVAIIILMLFGQEPDSIIKAWTHTADWTFSQKISPEKIPYDSHYLCTVSAKGHRKIVKPIRTGIRHNHRVVVNRQLMIANAFEQILEEKTPKTHKFIRKIYDKYGYEISKHIKSKFLCDIIYILMKPAEWFFLLVLYTVDTNPENRIAVQYPHAKLPKT